MLHRKIDLLLADLTHDEGDGCDEDAVDEVEASLERGEVVDAIGARDDGLVHAEPVEEHATGFFWADRRAVLEHGPRGQQVLLSLLLQHGSIHQRGQEVVHFNVVRLELRPQ